MANLCTSFSRWLTIAMLAVGCITAIAQEAGAAGAIGWWESDPWADPERGFNWYPPDEPAKPIRKPLAKKAEPARKSIREMTSVAEIRKEAERLRDVAIITPTEANILAYLEANKYVMDKSAYFTDMWRRVVWQNPAVDYNTRNPRATFAQTALNEQRTLNDEALMQGLAKTHGVLFFYRANCQYCHMQAPIMKMLRTRYQIEVMAISLDGSKMKEFPDARNDNGISTLVTGGKGVETTPTLYLVSRDQKQIVPLGAGVLAMDEIVDRIRVLYSTRPGENF